MTRAIGSYWRTTHNPPKPARRKVKAEVTPRAPRQCEGCGRTFKPTRKDARFCAPPCRTAAWKVRTGYTTKLVGIKSAPEGGEDQKNNFPIC